MPVFLSISFIGFTFDVLGKLLIAFVTLRLHIKHFKTHHVDKLDLRLDVWLSTIGIGMIAVGYLFRIPLEMNLATL